MEKVPHGGKAVVVDKTVLEGQVAEKLLHPAVQVPSHGLDRRMECMSLELYTDKSKQHQDLFEQCSSHQHHSLQQPLLRQQW